MPRRPAIPSPRPSPGEGGGQHAVGRGLAVRLRDSASCQWGVRSPPGPSRRSQWEAGPAGGGARMRAGDGGSGREQDCSRPSLRLPSRPETERTREPAPGRARGSGRRPEEERCAGSQRSPSGRVRSRLRSPRDGRRGRSGEGAAVPAWAMGVPGPERLERGQRRLQVREERSQRGRGDLRGRGSASPRRVPRGSPCCLRRSSAFFGLCGPRGGSGPVQRRRRPLAFRAAPRSAAYVTPGASGRSCPAGSSSAPARGSELGSPL